MEILDAKLRKCDRKKLNESTSQYFDDTVACGLCDAERIRSGYEFVEHVAQSEHHISLAMRNDGKASQKALRFWLNALCNADAKILPREQEEVDKLFGSKSIDKLDYHR